MASTRRNAALAAGTLAVLGWAVTAAAVAEPAAYVVVLEQEPGAVVFARAKAAGQPMSQAALQSYRAQVRRGQDSFLQALSERAVAFRLETVAIPDFSGAATTVDVRTTLVLNSVTLIIEPAAAAAIANMPEVRRVERARYLTTNLDKSVDYIRAPRVYGDVAELTAFDDRREGFEGQGINVAVIDTGIDWSHEMFGGDPTPPRHGLAPVTAALDTNEKIIYYLSYLPSLVDDFGHGTHCSADAAGYLGFEPGADGLPGTGDDVRVHGVAPQARLMGYKVCEGIVSASGAVGGCLVPITAMAIEDAVSPLTLTGFPKPVAHVINLSLGGAGGPDDASSEAADNAALMGAVVVAAAGNEGPGERTLGSPAAGQHVIAVGASNDPGVYTNTADVMENGQVKAGTPRLIAIFAPDSNLLEAQENIAAPITARYVFAGFADTPDQVPATVAGNICLTERGSTATAADQGSGLFANKAAQCAAKGAIAMLAFNNVPGALEGVLAPAAIPVFTLSREEGVYLRDELGFDPLGISNFALRIHPEDPSSFRAGMAGFSSRGPVEGKGQIKPDVSAPGVAVHAATSPIGVPVLSMQSATRYTAANGTSFASPHVAGVAALLVQAHPAWGPAEIRTALINTATNLRHPSGQPKADGDGADDILSQGGGLVDVEAAATTPALFGVEGDGIAAPSILGSHSFGSVPVADSRVRHTETVRLVLRDVSGQGGTWTLGRVDNRGPAGVVTVGYSQNPVVVGPNGTAAVDASLTVDGDLLRQPTQLQGFFIATRGDGKTLRAPYYLDALRSQPAVAVASETEVYEGVVLAGDLGQAAGLGPNEGVTYVDVAFPVGDAAFSVEATLTFTDVAGGIPDLDFELFDPSGASLDRSAEAGGPEQVAAEVSGGGAYLYRVEGWANGPTDFTITSTQHLGGAPPTLQPVAAEFINSLGQAVDFDGSYTVSWIALGGEVAFDLERSTDGGATWAVVARPSGATNSVAFASQPNGEVAYRVRALFPGKIGFFVSEPSNEVVVVVGRRKPTKITSKVTTAVSNISFASGVFALDLRMTNQSSSAYLPLVELRVVRITSPSGTVRVLNADNGGSGQKPASAALFDYSHQLGADDEFWPGEATGARQLRFADAAAELFTFDVAISAYGRTSPEMATASSGASEGLVGAPGASTVLDQLLRFTVNPLTKAVTVQLISGS